MQLITEIQSHKSQKPEDWLNALIVPNIEWVWSEDDFSKTKPQYVEQLRFKQGAELVLETLQDLERVDDESKLEILLALSKFSNANVPWSSRALQALSARVLKNLELDNRTDLNDQLLKTIIQSKLRALSSLKSESRVSATGYRRQQIKDDLFKGVKPVLQNQFSSSLNELDRWKIENMSLLSTLYYVSLAENKELLVSNWGIILPLLLNYFDEIEGLVKAECCRILGNIMVCLDSGLKEEVNSKEYFKKKTRNHIMQTGVSEVFDECLRPCLLQLPKLTPPEKSYKILSVAYPTLFMLLKTSSSSYKEFCEKVTEIINLYCLVSLDSVKSHYRLMVFLIDELKNELIPSIGSYVLLSMSKLVRMLLDVVDDPFTLFTPNLLLDALDTLRLILEQAPQRAAHYRYDLLGGLIKLWRHLAKEEHNSHSDHISVGLHLVKVKLLELVAQIELLCEKAPEFGKDVENLVKLDPSLKILLQQ
ncbi:unnamed protein product [Kuraishia capsulata CBS 1993]|uniref:Uncharacterized protein n=1 Tax=Kuraishia capsulata CBS 1993 TaxID=1382522 RepID=W6MXK8_9ASCO|nr:uncharacterized protein KUCA_T00005052001 [Kuraishia capsulata CBS 1993]CDK29065.1 unnamed protein product [Kuraishia capsulata CBS 1993]